MALVQHRDALLGCHGAHSSRRGVASQRQPCTAPANRPTAARTCCCHRWHLSTKQSFSPACSAHCPTGSGSAGSRRQRHSGAQLQARPRSRQARPTPDCRAPPSLPAPQPAPGPCACVPTRMRRCRWRLRGLGWVCVGRGGVGGWCAKAQQRAGLGNAGGEAGCADTHSTCIPGHARLQNFVPADLNRQSHPTRASWPAMAVVAGYCRIVPVSMPRQDTVCTMLMHLTPPSWRTLGPELQRRPALSRVTLCLQHSQSPDTSSTLRMAGSPLKMAAIWLVSSGLHHAKGAFMRSTRAAGSATGRQQQSNEAGWMQSQPPTQRRRRRRLPCRPGLVQAGCRQRQ